MERKEMLKQLGQMKSKLMGAVAMLLVAAILMGSTSYAWFVLSTAPEVANLKTTAGANGVLEIALANTVTEGNLKKPGEPYGQSTGVSSATAMQSAERANGYWGNVIEITDSYGLGNITLYPSRLALSSALNNSVLIDAPLAIPEFGTDGRIVRERPVSKASYNTDTGTYSINSDYGVHLLGLFADGESSSEVRTDTFIRQEVVSTMAEYVNTAREELTGEVKNLLETHSDDIIRLLIELKFTRDPSLTPLNIDNFSTTSMDAIDEMLIEMQDISTKAYDSLRYGYMARASADIVHYPDTDEGRQALGTLYAGLSEMSIDSILTKATENQYDEIVSAIGAVSNYINRINDTKRLLDLAKAGQTDFLFVVAALFDISTMEIGGQQGLDAFISEDGTDVMTQLMFGETHDTDMYVWSTIDSGSASVFASLAQIIGDYSAVISDYVDYSDVKVKEGPVVFEESTDENGVKTTIYYCVSTDEETGEPIIDITEDVSKAMSYADFYAMMLDPAAATWTINMFVTSATAKESYNPTTNVGSLASVYNITSSANVDTSYEFTVSHEVTADKTAYGYSIDMAFKTSKAGNLELQKTAVDRITGLDETESTANGTYNESVMGGGSMMRFQVADDIANPGALMESIYIVFMDTQSGSIYAIATVDGNAVTTSTDRNGTVTATGALNLYSPSISNGTITKGNQRSYILAMEEDKTYFVTAIVYLNGDLVDSSVLSSTGDVSLNGSVNLQFTNSADLTPMEYTNYYGAQ